MVIIKIFLILILTLVFIILSFSSRMKILQRISFIFGYLTIFFFIIFPHYSDTVAHFFNIGTGKDLIIYITISILSLLVVIIYVDTKHSNRTITKIIRESSLQNAKKCK